MAKTIIDADKVAIETIAAHPTVVVREQAVRLKGDPDPLVVLAEADERTLGYLFGGAGFRGYVTEALVVVKHPHDLETAIDTAKDWRDKVRKRLVPDHTATPGAILPGVSAVWDIDVEDLPAEAPADFQAGYQTARMAIIHRTSEASHA